VREHQATRTEKEANRGFRKIAGKPKPQGRQLLVRPRREDLSARALKRQQIGFLARIVLTADKAHGLLTARTRVL